MDVSKIYNLPYHQSDHYWIGVATHDGEPVKGLEDALKKHGMRRLPETQIAYVARTDKNWVQAWQALRTLLTQLNALPHTDIAIVPGGEEPPGAKDITTNRKTTEAIDALVENLWLGDAMLEGRIECHMQPVLDKRGKVFGYEAFARLRTISGEVVPGGKIFAASRTLNIEHMIDRLLHVQAIKTFVQSDMSGFLFVNFVPGFIHRPEKYLEGLTEAAQSFHMSAKNIVLDFTRAETPRDALHLRSIFDYCRQKGYSIALDDINSVAMATRLVEVVHPDFIKLDMALVRSAAQASNLQTIRELVALAHKAGCSIIAEGVETEDVHQTLLNAGVDLFQGYLFSPPVAATPRKEVG